MTSRMSEAIMTPPDPHTGTTAIILTPAEIQSGHDRVKWAEGLILQLPVNHDGRNSWLLNYGGGPESDALREAWIARYPYGEGIARAALRLAQGDGGEGHE